MSFSLNFFQNITLFSKFDQLAAAYISSVPLVAPPQEKSIDSEWLNSLDLAGTETLFIYGMGAHGEEYMALKKWLGEKFTRTLVFLVDDPGTLRQLMESRTTTDILIDHQVIIKFFRYPPDGDMRKLVAVFEWFFKTFSTGKAAFALQWGADEGQIHRGNALKKLFVRNLEDWLRTYYSFMMKQQEAVDSFYLNIMELLNAKFGQAMFGAFTGVPAIICGAGPSLSKQLDKLRGLERKAIIFGAGSGLNVLSRQGIIPHFAGGIDPTGTQFSRLSTNFAFQTSFFYQNRFNHEALHFVQGEKLFICGGLNLRIPEWFEEQLGLAVSPSLRQGLSTSNFCLEVAGALGCNPIILAGMDLSYRESERYAAGVTAHPAESRKHHQELAFKNVNHMKVIGTDGQELVTTLSWLLEAECMTAFSEENPDVQVWNATEGGIVIDKIPHKSWDQIVEEDLKTTYDFDTQIHQAIQQHGLDFLDCKTIRAALEKWMDSLKKCKNVLAERQQLLKKAQAAGKWSDGSFYETDLAGLLGEEGAYTHMLEQLNAIFNGLSGRDFFRMAHFPEMYTPEMCAEMSCRIDGERCRFLLENLDYHIVRVEKAMERLPGLMEYPRSSSGAIREGLTETIAGPQPHETEVRLYYATGELYAIKRFWHEEMHGRQEYYYVDGNPRTILRYSFGLLDGEVKLFYPYGKAKRELTFSNGRLNGKERMWNQSGTLIAEAEYADNKPVGIACSWHSNGVMARQVRYFEEEGDFDLTEWDEQGNRTNFRHSRPNSLTDTLNKRCDDLKESVMLLASRMEDLKRIKEDTKEAR